MSVTSSNSYHVGRGSASGQYSIVDGAGRVVSYADSLSDAEEVVADMNAQGLGLVDDFYVVNPNIHPFSLFRGYLFEKEHGYKGTFDDFVREVSSG